MRAFLAAIAFMAALTGVASAAALPSADSVIAHYIAAIGGAAKVNAIQTLITRGRYTEGTESFDAALAKMRPYYKLVGDPDKPITDFAEGYDGSAWEYYGGEHVGIVIRTVGDAAGAGRHGDSIMGPLIDYRDQGSTVTMEGIEKIGGSDTYHLRVHMRDGFEEDEFIDAKTWLLAATRRVAPIHAFGQAIKTETRWSDWRRVDGILFPFLSQEVEIATGKVLNAFVNTVVIVNQKLDVAVFSPPAFKRTPYQMALEALYMQRDDPKTVDWTYRDFKRAFPEVDSDIGMRTVGYLILKAGQTDAAIVLLTLNAHDYPKSAGAAFGLGRAYRTAGRYADARAVFTRGATLDPKDTRAVDALKEMDAAHQ